MLQQELTYVLIKGNAPQEFVTSCIGTEATSLELNLDGELVLQTMNLNDFFPEPCQSNARIVA